MNDCYAAALSANTTTVVALFVGAVLGLVLVEVASVIVDRWKIRQNRKRIDTLMADTEAEFVKYRAGSEH